MRTRRGSYGLAEEFLARLADRGYPDMTVGSEWGYRYTGDWRLDAPRQEVKDHSLAVFESQLAQTRANLGSRLALYQVHSLTEDSGVLSDTALLAAMARLRGYGGMIGLTTSGPLQATTLRRALDTIIDGQPLFSAAEVTWNLLEPSVEPQPPRPLRLAGPSLSKRRWGTAGSRPAGTKPARLPGSPGWPRHTG